jgi:hypothetical protein
MSLVQRAIVRYGHPRRMIIGIDDSPHEAALLLTRQAR